jgi:WD repeat-containing protein 19
MSTPEVDAPGPSGDKPKAEKGERGDPPQRSESAKGDVQRGESKGDVQRAEESGKGTDAKGDAPASRSSSATQKRTEAAGKRAGHEKVPRPSVASQGGMNTEMMVFGPDRNGSGAVRVAWQPGGRFVATYGANAHLIVSERLGTVVTKVVLKGALVDMGWDSQGDALAVAVEGSEVVTLWDKSSRETKSLKTGLKDGVSVLTWQPDGPKLGIGGKKGHLVIYDHSTKQKKLMENRHSKRILTACWSQSNLLALGSEDKKISVCREDGTIVENQGFKEVAAHMMFAEKAATSKGVAHNSEKVLSMNLVKTVYLFDLDERDHPTELAFQPKYGKINVFRWFADGYMMLGFSEGYFVVISTNASHIGQELNSAQLFKSADNTVTAIEYCAKLQRVAVAGENAVKVFQIGQWTVVQNTFKVPTSAGFIRGLSWTSDGRLLSAATEKGSVHTFITEIPLISAHHGTRWCNLIGLQTIGLWNAADLKYESKIELPLEPQHLALGPEHCIAASGHVAFIFAVDLKGGNDHQLVGKRQLPGRIDDIGCNDTHFAALIGGKVYIRALAEGDDTEEVLPSDPSTQGEATCMYVSAMFVIVGTSEGNLFFFHIQDWAVTSAYTATKGNTALMQLFPNHAGTRAVITDANGKAVLYSPVTKSAIPIEKFPEKEVNVVWDVADRGVFAVCTRNCARMHTYVHVPVSSSGEQVRHVAVTKSAKRQSAVLLHSGSMTVLDHNGAATKGVLASHDAIGNVSSMTPEKARRCFHQTLAILRLPSCWDMADKLHDDDLWTLLGKEALRVMDVATALGAYRKLNDVPMAMALQGLKEIEERNLLAGHISMLIGEYAAAEQLFVASSQPVRALEMRRGMQHYDQALDLANKFAKDQVPFISYEYALQLEYQQSFKLALGRYQSGVIGDSENGEHDLKCKAGEVRMMIRLGNASGGCKLALEINDTGVFREAAEILSSTKQFQDAATMYEKGEMFDKAVALYFQVKNYTAAAPLMDKVTSPKLFQAYGEVLEREKKFADAERAYVKAKSLVDVIRLNLSKLNNPKKAFELVRRSRNQEGARLVADFCQQKGDFKTAVEFMLLAKLKEEAFAVASKHNQMDAFAEALGDSGSLQDYQQMATYFDKKAQLERAGTFYAKCTDFPRAMERFLQGAEKHGAAITASMKESEDGKTADPRALEAQGACIDAAIEVLGMAKDPSLTAELLAFLMDDRDGIPKSVFYIFKVHMALEQYEEAANTAIIIAKQEQDLGNYKVAHGLLFDTFQDLMKRGIMVPLQLRRNLMLLHSYVLARVLVRLKDHKSGARMLVRVGNNISKFPAHSVGILTSAVVTCQRAGLKQSAYNFAKELVRPENRAQLDKNYKKKIEMLVRKPDLAEDVDPNAPCPNCDNSALPRTELNCPECKTTLPYCVITGRHMVLDDWSQCPSCAFPALFGPFRKYISAAKKCPMCENAIQVSSIQKNPNPKAALKHLLMEV